MISYKYSVSQDEGCVAKCKLDKKSNFGTGI
jgi:hypothetical protein